MLGRRITAIRKAILGCDSAIIGGDYKAYKESLFDESHLILDKDDKPTYFLIRQLTDAHKDAIAGEAGTRKQAKLACRCALVGVENYMATGDGNKPSLQIDYEEHITCGKIVSREWFANLNLPTEQLLDLYLCIDYHSEAQLPLSKRSVVQFGQAG